ncbi:MAG TPA: DUF2617 family protein [Candidatus Dietzia intestinipullorum]|nr:DUF2617 family protein [Candidatus Dietzia intestinipullorum]
MTLHELDVVPSDVASTALGYRVGPGEAPGALARTRLDHPGDGTALRLSILGASHAVTLVVDGHDAVTEEVSCRAIGSGGSPLPAAASYPGRWGTHHLSATTETFPAGRFAALVDELEALAEAGPGVLAGRFPGRHGALTVVAAAAEHTGWHWRTWHLYPHALAGARPGGGEVVATASRIEAARLSPLTGAAS